MFHSIFRTDETHNAEGGQGPQAHTGVSPPALSPESSIRNSSIEEQIDLHDTSSPDVHERLLESTCHTKSVRSSPIINPLSALHTQNTQR